MGRSDRWHQLLSAGDWYCGLPGDLQQALLELAVPQTLKSGHCLFRKGNPPDGLYAILEGLVSIANVSGTTADSKNVVLVVLQPSNWFGEIALFDKGGRTHDAYARGKTSVLHFSQARMEKMLGGHPTYWRDFGRLLAGKIRLNFQTVEGLMAMPAKARLATRLLLIADGYGWRAANQVSHPNLKFKVSQSDLAEMLGYTRQTINVMLQEMQSNGWIEIGRESIQILNASALQFEAEGSLHAD